MFDMCYINIRIYYLPLLKPFKTQKPSNERYNTREKYRKELLQKNSFFLWVFLNSLIFKSNTLCYMTTNKYLTNIKNLSKTQRYLIWLQRKYLTFVFWSVVPLNQYSLSRICLDFFNIGWIEVCFNQISPCL